MAIRLANNNRSLELRISAYEFDPDKVEDIYDKNWLYIEGTYTKDGKTVTAKDPSLLTWEVKHIRELLQDVLDDNDVRYCNSHSEFVIMEPNIEFSIWRKAHNNFKVHMHFAAGGPGGVLANMWLTLSADGIRDIIRQLDDACTRYPERA